VISSTSNFSSENDFKDTFDAVSGRGLQRFFSLGKITRTLRNYEKKDCELTKIDKRLLKGFYVSNNFALVNSSEEEIERWSNNLAKGNLQKLIANVKPVHLDDNIVSQWTRGTVDFSRSTINNKIIPDHLMSAPSDNTEKPYRDLNEGRPNLQVSGGGGMYARGAQGG